MKIPIANPILTVHYIIITGNSKQTIKETTHFYRRTEIASR